VCASLEVPGNHNALPGSPLPLSSVSILSSPDLDEMSHCAASLFSVREGQGPSPPLVACWMAYSSIPLTRRTICPFQGTFRRLTEGIEPRSKNWKSRKKMLDKHLGRSTISTLMAWSRRGNHLPVDGARVLP